MTSAADVLRTARRAAGLSQVELAHAAGVTQSVISAYENGHREPSLTTLRRLVEATGQALRISIEEPRVLPDTVRGRLLRRVGPHLRAAAAARGGANLRVFGSVARGSDQPHSDIDLLVDLPEDTSLLGLIGLERELVAILGEPVDLVPARSLRPEVAAAAARDAVAV